MARRGAAGRRPKFARPWADARGQILSFGMGYINSCPAERAPWPGARRTAWQAVAFATAESIEGKFISTALKKNEEFFEKTCEKSLTEIQNYDIITPFREGQRNQEKKKP